MAIDFTAAELAQSQRDMTHNSSFSSAQRLEEAAARRQAAMEAPGQLAAGAAAGIAGAPVDITNMFTKSLGLRTDKPILGSEWIGEKMRTKTSSMPFQIGTALPLGPDDLAKGMVGMIGMAKSAGKLEDALKAAPVIGKFSKDMKTQDIFAKPPVAFPSRYIELEPKEITVLSSQLVPTQGTVKTAGVLDYAAGRGAFQGDKVQVVKQGKDYLIVDGHHRATAELMSKGADKMQVELIGELPVAQDGAKLAAKFDRASARALSPAERLSLAKEFRLQRMAVRASKADPMR